jgi:CotH kinase protein/Putative metal-binding motif
VLMGVLACRPAVYLVVAGLGIMACSGGTAAPDGGTHVTTSGGTGGGRDAAAGGAAGGGTGGAGGVADGGASDPRACSDVFDPTQLRQYWIDISPDEWAELNTEFMDIADVENGTPPKTYHPIVFHYGSETGETVTDAAIRLKGQSSWVLTVQNDPMPKMQFVISFSQTNSKGSFHGLGKIAFDMPRSDWTFLHERLANTWWRQRGVAAPCANSGQIFINGAYYGLYVAEESVGHHLLGEYFPGNASGGLYKGAVPPDQNTGVADTGRLQPFWAAADAHGMAGIIDLDSSLLEWAGEALLNDGDGYYGGSHNFYVYDQGAKGFVWLPTDLDSTIDWLAYNSSVSFDDHPIFWWEGRTFTDPPGQHFLTVINDPALRQRYVNAIAAQLQGWNVPQMQTWIDDWSKQIAQAVKDDPRKMVTYDGWQAAVAEARDVVAKRPVYLQSFVDCEHGPAGADADGDGYRWCEDCRDNDKSVHPGAPEICGNQVDDNCNGIVDEGCPTPPNPDAGAPRTLPDGGSQ